MTECLKHDWKLTGRQDVHVEFPSKTKGVRRLFAFYLRCATCGQNGFKTHPNAKTIYTWRRP